MIKDRVCCNVYDVYYDAHIMCCGAHNTWLNEIHITCVVIHITCVVIHITCVAIHITCVVMNPTCVVNTMCVIMRYCFNTNMMCCHVQNLCYDRHESCF